MKLNDTAYVHKEVRNLCSQFELVSGMKLITNLSEEFEEVRFLDKYGYVIIDFWEGSFYVLSHRLTYIELRLLIDIKIDLQWLNLPNVRSDLFHTKNPCKNPHKKPTKTRKSSAKKH